MSKTTEMREALEAELEKLGCTVLAWETANGGHQRVRFRLPNGQERFYIAPKTPGERRSLMNNKATIRRIVRQHEDHGGVPYAQVMAG